MSVRPFRLQTAVIRPGKGFSLIELLITLAVLVVVIAIAAPSFTSVMLTQRIKTASFDVISSLSFARSEAIKQNGSVTLTPTASNWASGWTITGPDGTTLKTQDAFENLTITGPASLVYGRSGRITAGSGNTIQIDDNQSNAIAAGRCVTVDVTGLPRARQGSCS